MKRWILGALCAAMPYSPAIAAVSVEGMVEVYSLAITRTWYWGPNKDSWPEECDKARASCETTEVFNWDLRLYNILATSQDGVNFTFTGDNFGLRAVYSGTARYLGNGDYQGLTLSYSADRGFAYPYWTDRASSTNFIFRQIYPFPVPEPATWLILILGFGLVGWRMRATGQVPTYLSVSALP